jgi:hypothetical protein
MAELSGTISGQDVDLNSDPPKQSKPFKASKPSLFQQAGSRLQSDSQSGFGQEGGSPEIMALQFMAMIQKGIQGLSAMYPGLTPLTSDVMGRLQMAVPALIQDSSNGGMGMIPIPGQPAQQPPANPMMSAPPPMGGGSPMAGPPGASGPIGPVPAQ